MARVIPSWVTKAKQGTTGKRQGLKHGFRSGLEVKIGQQIEAHSQPVVYETFRLPYMVPAIRHHYTPDFKLRNNILIEAKGIFDSTDRAKHLYVKEQFPGLDIRFVFSNSNAKIGPGSKTTLAMWCKKYGYKYADKLIPENWFHEQGPELDPEELIKLGPYSHVSR